MGLNPCFSGTYSQSWTKRLSQPFSGLNPCFSGTYSQRFLSLMFLRQKCVLILVLVEHTLRDSFNKVDDAGQVLILVLVEHTLRVNFIIMLAAFQTS